MAADFSRVRLNALLDFAGVELKQGGVLLDADANESMAILDRRLRALASDVLGRATVSATTPNAFKLSLASGQLQIGKGRLYVDGLLAENHGALSTQAADRQFDDLLAEPVFANDVAYDAQPYLLQPPALPTGGRHLVYLDVWNREVTHLEAPELVESAVGVETSSRIQTVWQVRVLADDAGSNTDCSSEDDDLAGWSDVIAPSTGVLSTGTYEVAPADDPCELPATGGYRGLENQLYRVEIHDAGTAGAGATFKWSRENASVGSAIASFISGTELELPSLGRDDVLRFNTGDWVEITDDVREFSQAAGEIRRITVNEATRRISFSPALPGAMLPTSFPNTQLAAQRHLRVRRWDQKGRVFRRGSTGNPVQIQDLDAAGSSGVINVPAAGVEVLLENGVTVSFDSTGTTGFRSGDYWVFAARTADTSVEILDRAPPRGVHHHYARLGIWDVAAGTVSDCRNPWPPSGGGEDCGCTACVSPATHASGQFTIQDAVNLAAQTGGTVCLRPGTYALQQPVRLINARSLRIRGQGPHTVLLATNGAFALENCMGVGIENLSILSVASSVGIAVQSAIGLSLRELVIAMLGKRDVQGAAIALSGTVAGARIRDNAIVAPLGIIAAPAAGRATTTTTTTTAAASSFLMAAAITIEDNLLWCERRAVAFVGSVLHLMGTRISDNEILACRDPAVALLGMSAPGASIAARANTFNVAGDGIQCGVDGAWLDQNKLLNNLTGAAARASTAAGIALVTGLDKNGSDQCQILANQISGFRGAGIRIGSPTRELIVKLNIIENCGNGIVSTDDANGGSLSIENNQLRNIGADTDDATTAVVGIGLTRAVNATITGNVIRSVAVLAQRAALRAGVHTVGVQRVRVSGNEITDIAPPGDFLGASAGIMIRAPFLEFDVNNNHVQRDTTTVTAPGRAAWHALLVLDADPQSNVSRAGLFTTVLLDDARMMVLGGGTPFLASTGAAIAGAAQPVGTVAAATTATTTAAAAAAVPLAGGSVLGNTFLARAAVPAVQIVARGECLFSDNRVESRANDSGTAVFLTSAVAIISGNRVRGGEISIRAQTRQAAVLGNITTGAIVVPNGLQDPWAQLNLRG